MKLTFDPRRLLDRLRAPNRPEAAHAEASPLPIIRKMGFDFGGSAPPIPRHWLGGSVLGTHVANGLNLVFPAGERFFVRSVNHYLDEVTDPVLRDRVRRFYGQEGQHAKEHERFFAILRAQGLDIDTFLNAYQKYGYELLEPRVPHKLRLSITVALEHFTAVFAEHALTSEFLVTQAPKVVSDLLLWHACEEIEHKDVAFDVLAAVDDDYALRITGLVAATALLIGFWAFATATLMRQEPLELRRLAREGRVAVGTRQLGGLKIAGAFLTYLAPDFHPSQIANYQLARDYLERIGRAHA
jgi:predicted metal-dependent hydrolase